MAGEENLLAHYLSNVDAEGLHAFAFDSDADAIAIDESWWSHFSSSDARRAQVEHDEVSYIWDHVIESFAGHAFSGTQYYATEPGFDSTELILRFLAAESRFRRRMLGQALFDCVTETPEDQRRIRVIPQQRSGQPMYVFLVLPWMASKSEDENREFRRSFLVACVMVARMKIGPTDDIVGIATESGTGREQRSHDVVYYDARGWSATDEARAGKYQLDLDILTNERQVAVHMEEYPTAGE